MGLFFLPFLSVGLFTGFMLFKQANAFFEMKQWVPTPAQLLSAKLMVSVKQTSDGKSTSYNLKARYTYSYTGQSFTATKSGYDEDGGMGLGLKSREALLITHIKNSLPFTCYVNPENPQESVLFTGMLWDKALMWALCTLIFGGVGAGGFYFLCLKTPESSTAMRLAQTNPDEPWKWKKDWSAGKIYSQTKTTMIVCWFLSVFILALSLPMCLAFKEEWTGGNKLIAIGLIFPMAGLFMVYASVRKTIQWRKFGKSFLSLETNPGMIGGIFKAMLHIPSRLYLQSDCTATLNCFQTITTGSGKNRSTTKKLLWQDKQAISKHQIFVSQHSQIPVTFKIPSDCQATDESRKISWELSIHAPVPGVDFESDFVIPVFKLNDSLSQHNTVPFEVSNREEPIAFDPATSKIRIERLPEGLQIKVPSVMKRNPGMVIGFSLFTAVWSLFLGLIMYLKAPFIFALVFGLFDLLFVLILVSYILGSRTINITPTSLELKRHMGLFIIHCVIFHNDILQLDVSMSSSSQSGNTYKAYYSLTAHCHESCGKNKMELVNFLGSKQEAMWLKQLLMKAMPGIGQNVPD